MDRPRRFGRKPRPVIAKKTTRATSTPLAAGRRRKIARKNVRHMAEAEVQSGSEHEVVVPDWNAMVEEEEGAAGGEG